MFYVVLKQSGKSWIKLSFKYIHRREEFLKALNHCNEDIYINIWDDEDEN